MQNKRKESRHKVSKRAPQPSSPSSAIYCQASHNSRRIRLFLLVSKITFIPALLLWLIRRLYSHGLEKVILPAIPSRSSVTQLRESGIGEYLSSQINDNLAGNYVRSNIDDKASTSNKSITTNSFTKPHHTVEDEADFIIRRSYERTYSHIRPCEGDVVGEKCWRRTIQFFLPRKKKPNNSHSGVSSVYDDSNDESLDWEDVSKESDDLKSNDKDQSDDQYNNNANDSNKTTYSNNFRGAYKAYGSPDGAVKSKPKTTKQKTYHIRKGNNLYLPNSVDNFPPTIPWWFQTFLRDLPNNGAFGWWHDLNTINPPLQFCTIEKVSTTEWHEVFCRLNPKENEVCQPVRRNNSSNKDGNNNDNNLIECKLVCDRFQSFQKLPVNAPRAVFLRDPLERLLSAFLNKCYDDETIREGHCEPNVVFHPRSHSAYNSMNHVREYGYSNSREGQEEDRDQEPLLLQDIRDNDQQFFAAYVDVLPLKWNLHVVPQAVACDLYRNFNDYDFVGNMDEDFMM
ncbi:hypothetical protein ACHAXS_001451, partial [Conticribra weissflogii]